MNRHHSHTLNAFIAAAVESKDRENEDRIANALSGTFIISPGISPARHRTRTCLDFGVETEIPAAWVRADNTRADEVMYYRSSPPGRISAALKMTRRRGDYRGYENMDQLERLVASTVRQTGEYALHYIDDVNVGGRHGVRAVCSDSVSVGGPYDVEIYAFYKSKTEVMLFYCITGEKHRAYYRPVFERILQSIHYLN
jgi:hypothetical protein